MASQITSATNNFSNLSFHQCNSCHKNLKDDQVKKCARCKAAIYCGVECQTQDWKAVHQKVCKELTIDTTTPYTTENESIRRYFATFEAQVLKNSKLPKSSEHLKTEKYNHILQTQRAVLEGSGHLNPDTSVVVVCGAQFYEDKFVEPLPQLLEKCKKLILVDIDPVTLQKLHTMLGSSSKVSTVVLDLTCALKDIPAFNKDSSKLSPQEFIASLFNFLEKVTKDTEKRAAGLAGVLGEAASADYVISSLVASELSVRLKAALFSLFSKKFGSDMCSSMTSQLYDRGNEVVKQSTHVLTLKHAEDLCAWAGEAGRVYFADTYKFNNNTLITEKTISDLRHILDKKKGTNKLTKNEWHWIANKSHDYSVISLLS
jgi:hypothetical protein